MIEFEREVLSSIADRFDGLRSKSFVITYADKVNLLRDCSGQIAEMLAVASIRIPESVDDFHT